MPKERKAIKTRETCSFCGDHKDDVPLMITAQVEDASCCSNCALAIIQQTYAWAGRIFNSVKQEGERQKQATSRIITGDSVDAAIQKVQS